ncbi:sonic hedgehog protein-like isoform X1 [Stylophora pistillata]|uniref:sonic hedgehog protein-like isoform X1 n=1 Tax=Stylophora pistillata TaxID=50429 RepID=UPI000C04E690|nr:sonic hedgehog protein-like isoform X1 [Stylophora pistillata]XP_022784475.1 sonic hedgehog protein-like isoform X1 [Stylophora pistillata]XP_022784476.1 sonic hedgehog protein-like isoform X1 [Stylophora pistillata]XP_022784477.1 sonic hedgehog protein-like isoform X1 [Stylophora pistillata]
MTFRLYQRVCLWSKLPTVPQVYFTLAIISFVCGSLLACGPGPTGTNTRSRTPMKFRQRIPDVEETSIQASGEYVGRVKRSELEENFNTDIVFKNDEKNEDDRRMTKNCQDKLAILAAAVKTKWGVRLRVIDAYDVDSGKKHHHGKHSLHHEGRAVDITTEDLDRAKYPQLGRMANEAGFDWVYYATRSYIHASVKTEDAEKERLSYNCFPEIASVRLEGGRTKTMKELKIGDKVAAMDTSGRIVYSRVVTFLDIKPNTSSEYLSIQTRNPEAEVTITESHLIYQLNKHSPLESVRFARDLRVGDFVYVRNGAGLEKFTAGRVSGVKRSTAKGAYAPLTETGNILVDNVLCSCYAVISNHELAHWSFAPLRFADWLFPGITAHNSSGMHWYARTLHEIYTSWYEIASGN